VSISQSEELIDVEAWELPTETSFLDVVPVFLLFRPLAAEFMFEKCLSTDLEVEEEF